MYVSWNADIIAINREDEDDYEEVTQLLCDVVDDVETDFVGFLNDAAPVCLGNLYGAYEFAACGPHNDGPTKYSLSGLDFKEFCEKGETMLFPMELDEDDVEELREEARQRRKSTSTQLIGWISQKGAASVMQTTSRRSSSNS